MPLSDHLRIPGLNSGEDTNERRQIEAHAQLITNASLQIGHAAQQTSDTAAVLRHIAELLSRPGGDHTPQVRRVDFAGVTPADARFELPNTQHWQIATLLCFARDGADGSAKLPSFVVRGLLGAQDTVALVGGVAGLYRVELGIPVYPTQELTFTAAAGTAATVNHTVYLTYAPIAA